MDLRPKTKVDYQRMNKGNLSFSDDIGFASNQTPAKTTQSHSPDISNMASGGIEIDDLDHSIVMLTEDLRRIELEERQLRLHLEIETKRKKIDQMREQWKSMESTQTRVTFQSAPLPPLQRESGLSSFSSAPLQTPQRESGLSSLNSASMDKTFQEDVVMGNAVVPKDVANKALNGNYIDLSKMLIAHSPADHETFAVKDGRLSVTKRQGVPINSYNRWLRAWCNFEELLVAYHLGGGKHLHGLLRIQTFQTGVPKGTHMAGHVFI